MGAVYRYDGEAAQYAQRPGFAAIYGLIDPRTNTLRYIGYTNDLKCRLSAHMINAQNPAFCDYQCHRARWLRVLIREGLQPRLRVLTWTVAENAGRAECFYIARARAMGFPLVNGTDGGDGGCTIRTPEQRERVRLKRIGKKQTPWSAEARARSSVANKARWASLPVAEQERRLALLADAGRKGAESARGKQRTPEHMAKLWAGRRRYVYTPEHRAKIGQSKRGVRPNERQRAGLALGNAASWAKPRSYSEPYRQNLAQSHRTQWNKLSDDQRDAIVQRRTMGEPCRMLAAEYGIHNSIVSRIARFWDTVSHTMVPYTKQPKKG